ncbi:MAG: hypothetical protein Q9173_003189 [Seirophora scorigena]
MEVLRGPLEGLSHLHASHYMHLDVSVKNMFLMSSSSLWAVLGDLGKAIRSDTDRSDRVGPAQTRAPEVNGRTYYNNKIDIWSMGFALMSVLVPDLHPDAGQSFELKTWHDKAAAIVKTARYDGALSQRKALAGDMST